MNLKQYLLKAEKPSKYRIKSIRPLGDNEMDIIEKVLMKYRPKDVSRPKKMMFQKHPLDYVGVENVEVYYIDVEVTVPVSPHALENEIEERLGLAFDSNVIQVISDNDPRGCCMNDDEEEEKVTDEKTALLLDPDYKEVAPINPDDFYGDNYNKKFTDYLNKVREERKYAKAAEKPKEGEPEIDSSNFNDGIPFENAKYSTIKASQHKSGLVMKPKTKK